MGTAGHTRDRGSPRGLITIAAARLRCVLWCVNSYLVQAHVGISNVVNTCGCKCMNDTVAAFLVGAGEYSSVRSVFPLPVSLSTYLPLAVGLGQPACLPAGLSVGLLVFLLVSWSVGLLVGLSVGLSVGRFGTVHMLWSRWA